MRALAAVGEKRHFTHCSNLELTGQPWEIKKMQMKLLELGSKTDRRRRDASVIDWEVGLGLAWLGLGRHSSFSYV